MHCDRALSPYSASCRTRQYCIDLAQMEAISQELEKQGIRNIHAQQTMRSWNYTQSYGLESTNHSVQATLHRSPAASLSGLRPLKPALVKIGAAEMTSAGSLACGSPVASLTACSCPSTPASSLLGVAGKQRARRRSTLTSSVGLMPSSSIPSHPPNSDGTHSTRIGARCPDCNFAFRGSTSDSQKNLERHRRNIHSRPPKVLCMIENCPVAFTRSDNRRKHCQTQHGFEVVGKAKKRKAT